MNLESNKVVNGDADEISLKDVLLNVIAWKTYVLSKWKIILIFSIIGGLSGVIYSLSRSPVYTATCTFVLEDSNGGGGGLGQYAGLASMMGFDFGGGGSGGGIFQGDNLLELYKSRKMVEKALLSPVIINNKRDLLINRYIKINKLRDEWADNAELSKINFSVVNVNNLSRAQTGVLIKIIADINRKCLDVSKLDKRTSIITVEVKSNDEIFSKLFNDKIVSTVNDFYIQTKTKKAVENMNILKHQTDSIKTALHLSLTGVAASTDANPNANLSRLVLRVPTQSKQVDAEANKAMLSELIRSLEMSKVSLRKETPLIQIIDEPVLPLDRKTSNLFIWLFAGILLGSFSVIGYYSISLLFKKILQ